MLMFVLVAAALGFWWTVYNEDHNLRKHFLEDARMLSNTINWRRIINLTASETDLDDPGYRRIKEQLAGIHRASPNKHFVYLLGQRPDGAVVILADSEPTTSKEYSPPGQEYREATEEIGQVFASERGTTVGPYSDRWGRWVSAIVPVTDPESGRTLALLGLDIDARDWHRDLARETAESLALILILVVPLAVYVMLSRRSEKILRHASEEWRKTFDTIPDMITIVDSEHRIVRANRATWQKLGCDMHDLLHKPCYTVFHGTDSPPETCPHMQLMQDGLAHSEEIFEPRLNRHLDVTVTPLCDPDGKVTGSIHVAHDITVLKRAGEALRKSEQLYRSILTASPDTIAITDLERVIRMVSPAGLAMFGYGSNEELQGRAIVNFLVPEDRERARANIRLIFQGTLTGPDEYRVLRADGSSVMVEVNSDFIVGSDGRPESMIFVIRDISERKRVEVELNRKNAEIEQFIYTVSHDLRSPLVTVKTFMGYLEKDMAEDNREQLSQDILYINGAADKMKLLLDELLEMSRIGRVETPAVRVSVREILDEVLETLAGVIKDRTVDIRMPDTELMLVGDRPHLCQIWQNLIENAIKYSRDTGITRIDLAVQQANGETVFSVKDNGIGIDPQYHGKVFGIFEKLDPKSPGAGLGLSMVQRVVEKCGCRIWVESEGSGSGSGSCFKFTLPGALLQE